MSCASLLRQYSLLGVALGSLVPLVGLSGFLAGVLSGLLLSSGLCLAGVALGLLAVIGLLIASHCEKLRNVGDAQMRMVGGNETGVCGKIRRLVNCET